MALTIILFFFGIALASALIVRKIWQFRSGRIVPGSYEPADWTDLSIESIRMRLVELAKFAVHHFVLFALKVWIKTTNLVHSIDRRIRAKLTRLLHRNGHLPHGGKPSPFLDAMHAHKEEVASAIEKETE
jgi:hypothetical protein